VVCKFEGKGCSAASALVGGEAVNLAFAMTAMWGEFGSCNRVYLCFGKEGWATCGGVVVRFVTVSSGSKPEGGMARCCVWPVEVLQECSGFVRHAAQGLCGPPVPLPDCRCGHVEKGGVRGDMGVWSKLRAQGPYRGEELSALCCAWKMFTMKGTTTRTPNILVEL
jgi:hypothetical protein